MLFDIKTWTAVQTQVDHVQFIFLMEIKTGIDPEAERGYDIPEPRTGSRKVNPVSLGTQDDEEDNEKTQGGTESHREAKRGRFRANKEKSDINRSGENHPKGQPGEGETKAKKVRNKLGLSCAKHRTC